MIKKFTFTFLLFFSVFLSKSQCNLDISICESGALAGPFTFAPASNNPSTCLDFVNGQNTNNYAYIVLYITQGGFLNLLIEGNNTGFDAGCLDVAIFDITNLSNPCAQLSIFNEIGCNYVVPCDGCAEFGFAIGGCPAQIPAPIVQTGDVILILVEDWSNSQTSFSLSLGTTATSAQTGPPDATILSTGQICSDDPPVQLNAVNMGGTWSGPGVSANGVFNPAAAGLGTHTINYSIGSAPCNDSDQTTITVVDCSTCAFTFIQTDVTSCDGQTNTFDISGFVEFSTPPTTGTLTISDCNGNSQTFFPPFVSPINYAFNNIPAGGTSNCAVTATFSADPSCTITGLPFDYPEACDCTADVGTFTNTLTGMSNLVTPFNLCFDDELLIESNGDFIPPGQSTNNIVYDPGLWLLAYDCPPTIFPQGEINDDPCLLGVASENDGAWIIPNDIGDGETFYFVPITMYSMLEAFYTSTNSLENCFDMGPVYAVTYLPEVIVTHTSDCATGSVTATVSGGSAAVYGSNFNAQNLQPASASFDNTSTGNNGTITISGLVDGDNYSFDIIDENGCFVTVSGVFQGAPAVSITYPDTVYCIGQTNPTPSITGQTGGTFSASGTGLIINANTGQINLNTSSPGTYTVSYQVGPAACPSIGTTSVTITNTITPTFDQAGPFCEGSTIPALPTTSQNNISGTWSPALNNQNTTTYTFTPAANQCASTTTMTIEITPLTTPTFSQVGPFCQGATIPALPTTSTNGISGTWTPAINNQATTTYTFTPAAGECASTATMTIEISTEITPTFAQAGPFCVDAAIPALPTTSQNNITGNWSPALNNQATTTYTFTPDAGQCAIPTTMIIEITTEVTPTFAQVGPFCVGATIPALPTTSQNNISGTWSPALNNQATTTYTFTPNAGLCAVSTTMTVEITDEVTPTFDQTGPFCEGSTIPALPTTSQNNISGTWSPALNNQNTTTYTFTPAANQCASTTTMTVEITPLTTPTFSQVGPFCQGATIPALPTTSTNGISGTWTPAINNQATTTYTFTPAAGECASTATMTIEISTEITPTFAQAGPFCVDAAIPTLPTTSQNNITGTWSPALNNQATTTYTFTPDAGQCAIPTTMIIEITTEVTPTFAQVGPFCVGATIPALPTTSQNNISGTWSPALNNQATTTYTFTPNAGLCAVSTTMTVEITPQPPMPTIACYETATWNEDNCIWEISGSQPDQPPLVECWDNFVFNDISCTWENVGTPIDLPLIDLGPDQTICEGDSITFSAPAGYDSYLWSNGATSQSITVTQSGTYTVTGSVQIVSQENVVINPGFEAGNTGFTSSYTPGTGGTWGLVSNGNTFGIVTSPHLAHNHLVNCSYQGNMFVANGGNNGNNANVWCQTVTVEPNTNYIFSVDAINPHNDAGWGVLPLTLNLVVGGVNLGSLTPPLSPNNCDWQTYSSSIWNSGTNTSVTICIQNATTSANLLAIDNVSFAPVLECSQSGEITINVTDAITPTFVDVEPICEGTNLEPLPTTSTNGITGSWSPALNNLATTTYTFTPDENQCAIPTTLTIEVTNEITPTFAQEGPYCIGQNIPPLPTSSQNNISGTWSPALNNQNTETYTFTPNAGECAIATTMTIEITSAVVPTFEAVGPFCQGANIPALPTNSLNNVSGTWSPAVNNDQTTSYTFSPISSECATEQTLTIEIITPTVPQFDIDNQYCFGDFIPELPMTSQNNIAGTWTPAINNQQSTNYTFTPNNDECATTFEQSITVNQQNVVNQELSLCFGDFPYLWNGINIETAGTYQVLLSNQFGCDSTVILNLIELPLSSSNSALVVCENDLPIVWNGETFFNAGDYSVVLTNSLGCDSIANLNLSVESFLQPIFSANTLQGCTPLTVTFENNTVGSFTNCLWDFGNGQTASGCGTVSHIFNSEGCFDISLTLSSANGCAGTTTLEEYICVTQTPTASFFSTPAEITTTNPEVNFINTSINADTFSWNFGDDSGNSNQESPSHQYPEEQGEYVVTLVASNGICSDTATQLIIIQSEPIYYVPNTFTPDGDLFNQTFTPVFTAGFDPYNYNLLIFNRWGEVLFESNNAAVGWDGTYGGEICQDGTYIWQITFKELGRDKRHIIRGHVNLLR